MQHGFQPISESKSLPGSPQVCRDTSTGGLVHIYNQVDLPTDHFRDEVRFYLNRNDSPSTNVVTIKQLLNQRIVYRGGSPSMEVSVVSDYVPWRLHQHMTPLTQSQMILLLNGASQGFRELLHRIKTPFKPSESMVGISDKGVVKVWWNENFWCSHFSREIEVACSLKEMVKEIIRFVLARGSLEPKAYLESQLGKVETFVELQKKITEHSLKSSLVKAAYQLVPTANEYKMVSKGLRIPRISSINVTPQLSRVKSLTILPSVVQSKSVRSATAAVDPPFLRQVRQVLSPTESSAVPSIKEEIDSLRRVTQQTERLLTRSRSCGTFTTSQFILSPTGLETSRVTSSESLKMSRFVGEGSRVLFDSRKWPTSGMEKSMASTNFEPQESRFRFSQVKETRPVYFSSLLKSL